MKSFALSSSMHPEMQGFKGAGREKAIGAEMENA
jgi:hypothetical protein